MPPTIPPVDDDDVPLSFWESGPVRQLVDLEFQAALIREANAWGVRVTPDEEKALHDAIVPQAFCFAAKPEYLRQYLCGMLERHFFTL
jgi:hypothetical protein